MNGFRKNKGIIIELTALLDVILIMLFWVMMNISDSNDAVRAEADERVAEAQAQVQLERDKAQETVDSILEDTSRQIAEAQQKALDTNSLAAQNQQALDGYEQGLLVTLNLKYEDGSDRLYISQGGEEISQTKLNGGSLSDEIISAFEKLGFRKDSVILCALIYDGDSVLYRDVNTLNASVEEVREEYQHFYCTSINTTN